MVDMEYVSEFFWELSSKNRLRIISLLKNKSYRLSEIANAINSTPQEVFRNLARLIDFGMIIKTNDGDYSITDTSRIAYALISIPTIFKQNDAFFKSHVFGNLPEKFLNRIGALEDCTLITSVTKVLEKRKSICENAKHYVLESSCEPLSDDVIRSKVKQEITYHILLPIIHKTNHERKQKYSEHLNFIKDKIQEKFIDNVEFGQIINDNEAGLILPDAYGELDLRYMLYGTGKYFHDWCLDLYDYYWNMGEDKKVLPRLPRAIIP